eukprot:m.5273 g.5273  ORF g.5273 m.5273 type:complete len:455 (+) comp12698_c0_seq2:127-1491(+)
MDSKLSFSFAKKAAKRSLDARSALSNDGNASNKDFVLSVSGESIESTAPKKAKKEYIIPMKEGATGSGLAARLKQLKTGEAVKQEGTAEDKMAAEAILRDLESLADSRLGRSDNSGDEFAVDVASRPAESTLDDYDEMPVSQFGAALMRGMGWSEGAPIGLTNKEIVKPIEYVARQPGQGLGADSKEMMNGGAKKKRRLKPGEKIEKRYKTYYDKDGKVKHVKGIDEDLSQIRPDEMNVGVHVEVTSGFYKDFFGKVVALDEDTAHAVVQMAVLDKKVSVSQHTLVIVTETEYLQAIKGDKRKDRKKGQESRQNSSHGDGGNASDEEEDSRPWLMPDIRVRVVSKKYHRGVYYNEKVSVIDVVSIDRCVCKTDEGKLLEDVPQKVLETVVPRQTNAVVSIVLGKHKGQLGKVIERNKSKCRAEVQLLRDRNKLVRLDYGQISEYTGDLDLEDDY